MPPIPPVIAAHEFRVVDRFGLTRATIGMKSDINDQPVIELLHRNGAPALRVSLAWDERPSITLFDNDGVPRISLGIHEEANREGASIHLGGTLPHNCVLLTNNLDGDPGITSWMTRGIAPGERITLGRFPVPQASSTLSIG